MRQIARGYWVALAVALAAGVVANHLVANWTTVQTKAYPSEDYSVLEDGLAVGGMLSTPPSGTRAVLNVCETRDPYTAEVHRWEPIPDLGPAPSLEWLRSQVEFIDQQRKAGRPVYVHCWAGINRSVTVAAAYLMWRDGLTRDQALAAVRGKRPGAGPFRVYRTYLAEWEQLLRGYGGAEPNAPPDPAAK